jgi:hypothetical protein
MSKNLLIGAVDLYKWDQIKVWAKSFRQHNQIDDVVVLCYRVDEQLIKELNNLNIITVDANYGPDGLPPNHDACIRKTWAHHLRFFHGWQYLEACGLNYNYVLHTDTRDVWFQSNPFEIFVEYYSNPIIASSENIRYEHETWNQQDLLTGYGRYLLEIAVKKWTVFNSGVICGLSDAMKSLFMELYFMSQHRQSTDQAPYNILVNLDKSNRFMQVSGASNWAAQCGTSMDPSKPHLTQNLIYPYPPQFKNNGVYVDGDKLCSIVHQYDRVPVLKEYVEKLYV